MEQISLNSEGRNTSNPDFNFPVCQETKIYSGLFNQGNTCYLNSLLQCLFMTPEFRHKLFKWTYSKPIHGNSEDCIPFQLQKLFARLYMKYFPAESTEGLTKSFQWGRSQLSEQHDIQELCRVLFDALEQSAEEENFINCLYEGRTQSVVKCSECNYESINEDKYLDLSLPIRNEFDKIYNTSLEMAILNLLKEEYLENTNQYSCSKCLKKVNATKFTRLTKAPEILFIQLNRFEYDFMSNSRKKINDRVTFPDVLNLNNFIGNSYSAISESYSEENLKKLALMSSIVSPINNIDETDSYYSLFSIVIHAGTASSGHYYSLIKSFEDSKWYRFDDHKVYFSSDEELFSSFGGGDNVYNSSTAYCIMYRKLNRAEEAKHLSYQFKITKELSEFIEKENEQVAEEMKIREERFNTLNLKFNINGITTTLECKKYNTINELKLKLLEKGLIKLSFDIESLNLQKDQIFPFFRVRLFHLNKKMDVINNENLTLEASGLYSHKTYTIETRAINSEFEEYDPDKINLQIYFWHTEYGNPLKDNSELTEHNFKSELLKIHKKSNYNDFKAEIIKSYFSHFKVDSLQDLIAFTKIEYGINNFKIRELLNPDKLVTEFKTKKLNLKSLGEAEISALNIVDQMKIYVESVSSLSESKFNQFFEDKCLNVKILFNLPTQDAKKKPKVGSYEFNNEIEIKKTKSLKDLKKRISEIINLSSNEFIIRKNTHNGAELKNLNETIDKYTSSQFKVFVEKGVPLKESEIKITVCLSQVDASNFNVLPFKITKISDFSVDLHWNIKEMKVGLKRDISELILKAEVEDENKPGKKSSLDSNFKNQIPSLKKLDWSKIFVRDFNNEKATSFFSENSLLNENDFKAGKYVVLFEANNELQFESNKKIEIPPHFSIHPDKMHLTLRKWECSKWNMTYPVEVFVPKKVTTNLVLAVEIIQKVFPEIEVHNISCYKVVNPFNVYMDDFKKFKFQNLLEVGDFMIDNYPLYLNSDGGVLVVKDQSEKIREPTPEEYQLYCRQRPAKDQKVISNSTELNDLKCDKTLTNGKTESKRKFKSEFEDKGLVITIKKQDSSIKEEDRQDNELVSQKEAKSVVSNPPQSSIKELKKLKAEALKKKGQCQGDPEIEIYLPNELLKK